MDLTGKTAIVTGGGRGIGRAIARLFAQAGAAVCVMARSQDQIDGVAREIQDAGQTAFALPCDVTRLEQVRSAFSEATGRLGGLDILVNNAGGGTERTAVGDDDPTRWVEVIQLNLIGTYYCCRESLPFLKSDGGGAIINVGSGMGHQSRAVNSSYNTSKAGVWMLTRCLAQQLWEDNITVNELIPGPVETELTAGLFETDKAHPTFGAEWVKSPQDVGPMALFLAGQGRHGPTGQSFSLARRPMS